MATVTERLINLKVPNSWRLWAVITAAVSSTAAIPPISEQARAALDRTMGAKGVYVSEESAYRFTFLRTDVSLQVSGQRLSPAQAPRSWVTFSPSVHHQAMMNAELALLEDEVNPVMTVALKSGRKTLDEMRRVRGEKGDAPVSARSAAAPITSVIDAAPVNEILSMRGVVTDGIYRATIGRVALVNGTPIGREMGMSTAVSIFGRNDRAFADADIIVTPDELQRVLLALRLKNLNITSIRNHILG